jgi:hypothetical protein
MSECDIISFPKRHRATTARRIGLKVRLESVSQAKENLLRIQVAANLALMTLDTAPVFGDDITLDGVAQILAGLGRLIG